MNGKILSAFCILFIIIFFVCDAVKNTPLASAKNEKTKPVTVYVFDKKANKLAMEKGVIDSKGIVTTKCKMILKWFEEVENTLIVKTKEGKISQLGKILSCNIKKDYTSFMLEPLSPHKDYIADTFKPAPDVKTQLLHQEKIETTLEISTPDTAESLLQKGNSFQKSRNYDKAIESYKQALNMQAELPEAHINLGTVYFILGKYNDAIEAYNNSLRNAQDKNSILNKIGTSYMMLGDYNKAIGVYEQALAAEPTNPDILFGLGLAYFLSGKKEDAYREYIRLNKIDVQLAENLFDLLYR